jgi:hypothetical protein
VPGALLVDHISLAEMLKTSSSAQELGARLTHGLGRVRHEKTMAAD